MVLHTPPTFPPNLTAAHPWLQQSKSSGQVVYYMYLGRTREEADGWVFLPSSPPPFSCAPCCTELHKVINNRCCPHAPTQSKTETSDIWGTKMLTWTLALWNEIIQVSQRNSSLAVFRRNMYFYYGKASIHYFYI